MRKTELEVKIFGRPEILLVDDADLENNLIEATTENLDAVWVYIEEGKLFYHTEYMKMELGEDEIKIAYEGEFIEVIKDILEKLN